MRRYFNLHSLDILWPNWIIDALHISFQWPILDDDDDGYEGGDGDGYDEGSDVDGDGDGFTCSLYSPLGDHSLCTSPL